MDRGDGSFGGLGAEKLRYRTRKHDLWVLFYPFKEE